MVPVSSATGFPCRDDAGQDFPAAGVSHAGITYLVGSGSGPVAGNKESLSSVMVVKKRKGFLPSRCSPAPLWRKQRPALRGTRFRLNVKDTGPAGLKKLPARREVLPQSGQGAEGKLVPHPAHRKGRVRPQPLGRRLEGVAVFEDAEDAVGVGIAVELA